MSFVFKPQWIDQGKGARVIRIIQNQHLDHLDPFIMLDFFKVKLPAGFPDHPHRGFQTVTYMLQGDFYHEDFKGHQGKIGPGDLQWMTAGKGIVHSQMPSSFDQYCTGFQLWINLEAKKKLIPPAYQEYTNDKIKVYSKDKIEVKIISGKWEGLEGPIFARTPSYFFDVKIHEGGEFDLPIAGKWNTIIYVFEGEVFYQEKTKVNIQECCVLETNEEKDEIVHRFTCEKGGRFVLIGGQPLNETVAQSGPFVMNTKEEAQEAVHDYKEAKNGFEGAKGWESKIKYLSQGKKIEDLWTDTK